MGMWFLHDCTFMLTQKELTRRVASPPGFLSLWPWPGQGRRTVRPVRLQRWRRFVALKMKKTVFNTQQWNPFYRAPMIAHPGWRKSASIFVAPFQRKFLFDTIVSETRKKKFLILCRATELDQNNPQTLSFRIEFTILFPSGSITWH